MWFRSALVAAMTVLSVGAAQAQDDNPIIQRMAAFMQAYNAKNAGAIAQFYTEDGAVLPPQGAPILGREQIATDAPSIVTLRLPPVRSLLRAVLG